MATRGKARFGVAWRGETRQDKAGAARLGEARHGLARHGEAGAVMNDQASALSAQLRDELVANDQIKVAVDPRTVPLRFSTMKLIAQSPLHYLHAAQGGWDETLSMRIGTGTHAILFKQPFTIWTGKTRNGKAWDQFEKDHAGETILSQGEHKKSLAMANSILAHPTASRLLFTDTVCEKRIDWEWQGRAFRSTPDAAGRTHLVDLKCLRSSDPGKVKWQSANMFYHCQAAVYRRALNSTGEHSIRESFLVTVENKQPYPVTVFKFTDTALESGDRIAASWLEQVLACEASNSYPGYTQSIIDLELPMTDFIFDEEPGDEEDDDVTAG